MIGCVFCTGAPSRSAVRRSIDGSRLRRCMTFRTRNSAWDSLPSTINGTSFPGYRRYYIFSELRQSRISNRPNPLRHGCRKKPRRRHGSRPLVNVIHLMPLCRKSIAAVFILPQRCPVPALRNGGHRAPDHRVRGATVWPRMRHRINAGPADLGRWASM